jgi:adenosylhomocysteine nucleosidase
MSILVVCPLEDELNSLIEGLAEQGYTCSPVTVGRVAAFKIGGGVFLAQGGLGKATFGIRTQYLIDHLDDVNLVVCAGVSGGLHQSLSIGDVVVGTATVEHDFYMKISGRPLPGFDGHEGSITILRNMVRPGQFTFDLHFGVIASGDESIVDSARADEVRASTGAYAVGWEGAGGARACEFSNVPFLEIRGVSDLADHAAPEEFFKNLPSTMKNVASVVSLLLKESFG